MTSQPGLWNVANVLTAVRIALVPVFVACLLAGGTTWRLLALAAFCIASLTDFLDGRLARQRGLVTDFGKIADPVADKALTGAALICLSALGELPWWVTGLILFREIGVTALRFWVIRRGVIAASRGGKLKTLLQIIAICLYILPPRAQPARGRARAGHGRGSYRHPGDRRRLCSASDAAAPVRPGRGRVSRPAPQGWEE